MNLLCLSWCDADSVMNYGQILQGCAMMSVLRQLSLDKIYYLSYLPRGKRSLLGYIKNHYNPFTGHLKAYLSTLKIIRTFVSENRIVFSQIHNSKQIKKRVKNIDCMICGSDQIWHPQNYDSNYFLNFGNSSIKRISYAASLPKTHIEPQFTNIYIYIGIDKIDRCYFCS